MFIFMLFLVVVMFSWLIVSARWLLDNAVFFTNAWPYPKWQILYRRGLLLLLLFLLLPLLLHYEIRKSSWCKGKLAAAVRDEGPYRRSLQQINECDFQWLIVTVAVLLNVCEMSHMEVENRRFRLLYSDVDPIGYCWYCCSEGTPSNISVIYTSLKSTFSGLQLCCWQYTCLYSLFM